MSFKRSLSLVCMYLLISVSGYTTLRVEAANFGQQEASRVDFISAEDLKRKLAKNHPVTIIDVRATSGLLNNDSKIKGSFHVKLRRLKSRLAFPPLKNVPRDQEVVIYCACPNDESSIRAAQVLSEAGFRNVKALKGGWHAWRKANGQIESMAGGD